MPDISQFRQNIGIHHPDHVNCIIAVGQFFLGSLVKIHDVFKVINQTSIDSSACLDVFSKLLFKIFCNFFSGERIPGFFVEFVGLGGSDDHKRIFRMKYLCKKIFDSLSHIRKIFVKLKQKDKISRNLGSAFQHSARSGSCDCIGIS
jgi:hypothetical protein